MIKKLKDKSQTKYLNANNCNPKLKIQMNNKSNKYFRKNKSLSRYWQNAKRKL